MLGAVEHEHLVRRFEQQLREQRQLEVLVRLVHALRDRFHGGIARRHVDFERLVTDGAGEVADLVGEGRREHQVLPLLRQQAENLADVADEAHVQHAVGFVEHEHFERVELHRVLLVQVEQAAGSCNENVAALAQREHLRIDVDAAKDDD